MSLPLKIGRINSSDLGSEAIKAFLVDSSIMNASL